MDNKTLIKESNRIANSVQERFCGDKRDRILLTNEHTSLEYSISSDLDENVVCIKNSRGVSYIENTFDVFVRTENGDTFYASKSPVSPATNIFRFGYYYHDLHIEGQNFLNGMTVKGEQIIPLEIEKTNDLSECLIVEDRIAATIAATKDPYVALRGFSLDAEIYNYVQISAKTHIEGSYITVFLIAGEQVGFNHKQTVRLDLNPDGEFHTYNLFLKNVHDYKKTVKGIRLDLDGGCVGGKVEISDVRFLSADEIGLSALSISRIFHAYPDKLHHELQVVAHRNTSGIEAIGSVTEIAEDRVSSICVKDAYGIHDSLSDVDWNSAECVAFDIKEAGVFGHILPACEKCGKLFVTLDDGKYIVTHTLSPDGNKILSGDSISIGNTNDFYIGQRIYTDETHDFDLFLKETKIERSPLSSNDILVDEKNSDNGVFLGYNPLRGIYEFCIDGTGFNEAYFDIPNKHFLLDLNLTSFDDRAIYISAGTTSGCLECAALFDENMLMLPIPMEVVKNFHGDGDANIYNLLDIQYGEAIFPLFLTANETAKYKVAHLYQNWGRFPLKQLSSIEFYAPYYHISTGITETNCIKYRYTHDNVLPDHRPMSAPAWDSQPQHTSGGFNSFLTYRHNGLSVYATNIANRMKAYGPTYCEVESDYLSIDGKIAAKYTFLEFSQTDETRTYYTFEHTFLEDISFDSFKDQFSFYSMGDKDPAGDYQNLGYLDENNQPQITKAKEHGESKVYPLGDSCPYFDCFDLITHMGLPSDNYVNLGFILFDPEITVGKKPSDQRFAVKDLGGRFALTLDADKISFKAGDTIKFKAIIMPWGSQESDYSDKSHAPDINVRAVRENTVIRPAIVTHLGDCVIFTDETTPFVPAVKSRNGKGAEFTVSGGENNIAVRVYGIRSLTRPSVYEMINGKWEKYELSSINTPDKNGNCHDYDGYNVFSDIDGTYSYSFVITMTDGKERHFKFEA